MGLYFKSNHDSRRVFLKEAIQSTRTTSGKWIFFFFLFFFTSQHSICGIRVFQRKRTLYKSQTSHWKNEKKREKKNIEAGEVYLNLKDESFLQEDGVPDHVLFQIWSLLRFYYSDFETHNSIRFSDLADTAI